MGTVLLYLSTCSYMKQGDRYRRTVPMTFQKGKDRPNDIQFKYKRLEIIIRYAFFQTVYRIAKMNSVAFDSGAFHPEMVAIACIRDVNRQ